MTWKVLFRMFPDDATAEKWFVKTRWPNGVACPACGSVNVLVVKTRKPQPFRCRDCGKCFSVRTGTLVQGSNLGLQTWAVALYVLTTGIKGTSSKKLRRDLGVTQKTAWHLAHRIRDTWRHETDHSPMGGPVEADETFVGGNESNKHESQWLHEGRGPVGKTAVAGVKDRATGCVKASVVPDATGETLQGFVGAHAAPDAMVYPDGEPPYAGLPNHEAAKHSRSGSTLGYGAHHPDGVVLVDVQARLHRTYHKDVAAAFGTLGRRVRGTPQRPRLRHPGPDGTDGPRDGREAAPIQRSGFEIRYRSGWSCE